MTIPGFTCRITSKGIAVRRLHYSADSHKRPGTPEGDAWLAQEALAYPLGMDDPRWKKEMEIKYGALGGMLLFPLIEAWRAHSRIFIAPDQVPPTRELRLFASYDHGWASPSAFHVHGQGDDGKFYIGMWEFYAKQVPVHQISRLMNGQNVLVDGRVFPGCPYANQWVYLVSDPEIFRENLPQDNGPNKSTAQIFRDCGVYMKQGERGGDITMAEWLHGYFWQKPDDPKLHIVCPPEYIDAPPKNREYAGPGAPMLNWELGQARHRTYSEKVGLNYNQPEELVDKDNHAWDSWKYFQKHFPPEPRASAAERQPNTFAWWRKTIQREANGLQQRTFRVGSL